MNLKEYLLKNKIEHASIGDALTVGGYLDLEGCTGITALPDNLTVGGYLDLRGTGITALPDNLTVGGYLDLHENFSNVAYKKNCGNNNRTIFAAWVSGSVHIGAGCFLGRLDQFFAAVDEKYSGSSAEKYKADAQECSDNLIALIGAK